MGIETRIKEMRRHLDLTQTEFGDSLGVSRDVINSYERGRVTPTQTFIELLCMKYDVNPDWLIHGTGEMFIAPDTDDEIAAFLSQIMCDDDASIRKRFILALSKFDGDDWKTVEKFIDSFTQKEKDDQ